MSIPRINTSERSIGQPSADEARGHAQDCPAALCANQHDWAEARAYGAAFVKILGPRLAHLRKPRTTGPVMAGRVTSPNRATNAAIGG